MRRICRLSWLWLFASLFANCAAFAQTYPAKPVTLVTPFPPGGAVDLTARIMQQRLAASLGQPVIVDNRVGAGGRIGASYVSKATPDGYTMLFTVGSDLAMRQGAPGAVNLLTDLTPVATSVVSVMAIAMRNDLGAANLREVIELAKRNPVKLSYGSAGIATTQHLIGERLKQLGADMIHVPFKGFGPALAALVAGQVDLNITNVATVLPQARAGKVKIIAVIQPNRFDGLPDVPTVREIVPVFDVPFAWYAFFGPPALPAPIVARWNTEIARAVEFPELRQRLTESSMQVMYTPTEQMPALVRSTVDSYERLFKSTGITLED